MKYVGDGGKSMTDTCLLRDAVTHSIDKLTAEGKTAGCAVRVMLRGETVLSCEFGLSDIGAGTPLRADSVFRLASMTKPIVAVAVGGWGATPQRPYSLAIASSRRFIVSSLPSRYAISNAPPGVAARPVMAMRSGQSTVAFFMPDSGMAAITVSCRLTSVQSAIP